MSGKGDKPRPVDKDKYDKNYDKIFRKKKRGSQSKHHCIYINGVLLRGDKICKVENGKLVETGEVYEFDKKINN